VSFLKDSKRSPAFYLLVQSGWQMDYGDIRSLTSDDGSLRRDIGVAMVKALAVFDKKSEPAAV
jgi:hypothetical protein